MKPLEVLKVVFGELSVRAVEEDHVDREELVILEFDEHFAVGVAGRVTVLRWEVYEAVAAESLDLDHSNNDNGHIFNCNKETLCFTTQQ